MSMKKIAIIILCIVGVSFYTSKQVQAQAKSTHPEPLSLQDQDLLMSFPSLVMPDAYKSKTIPYMVDHSQSVHFRDMFVQAGMSCGQASSTGICFTYEMNAARDLEANTNAHLFPTGFVYNWDAGDYGGSGVSYYHTLEVLRNVGTPNQDEYGGTIDAGGNLRWVDGYDMYYSAMHNRIDHAYKIDVGNAEGLQTLKHWMTDHLVGDDDGGCAIFYSTVPYPDNTLPSGTEEAGMQVLINLSASTSHSMAILGFNDSIRYDYNSDGQYTNDIDITGDGQVTMADWEIGGIKMCNTYSGGPDWADGGFCYIMYKAIATGAFWHDIVHVMTVNPTYEPILTAKVDITYTNRKRIKVFAGIATSTTATVPEFVIDLPVFDYQGGERFMQGGDTEADKTIEFGLDISPLLNYIDPNQEAKYFIQVFETDDEGWGTGTLNSFSIINYSTGSPVETASAESNVTIPANGVATLSIVSSEDYDPVEISTSTLLSGAIMSPFSKQLEVSGGTAPYSWSFDMDFDISESVVAFPSGGTTLSGSGFFAVPLGFTFKYYGEEYSTIYLNSNGLVVFQPGFDDYLPYYNSHDATVFMHTKCIAPLYDASIASTMKSISGADYKTIIWNNSTVDYAMTIYEDGRIKFAYDNSALTIQDNYVCGVSNGDELNFQRLSFDDPENVSNGFLYELMPFEIPEEFEISNSGMLTGMPTYEYIAEDFHFKVIDNNRIVDRAVLPFVTDGLILTSVISTPDDDVIEYSETVNINLTATNPMASAVTGITISVVTTDTYITITDNTEACPDLAASGSSELLSAFEFDVSSDVPDDHEFILNFTVVSDQGTWDYFYPFTAYAPEIIAGDIGVVDGGDDILGPDETADIIIPISNLGGSDVHNLVITASTSDAYIILNTNTDNILSLEPEQEENATINISTASVVESQHIAEVSLEIIGDNGYSETIIVEITINTPIIIVVGTMVDDGDNTCLDPGETADVIFNIQNIGLIEATNLTATLATEDPLITINTVPLSILSMPSFDSELVTYSITVDASCDMAHFAEFILNVTGDNGLDIDVPCSLIIGILQETFETGDLSAFEWIPAGDADWHVVDVDAYEGTYCLRSGGIGNNQETTLRADMFVVAEGDISFMKKVSCENYYDFLEFLVDDLAVVSWSGEVEWSEYSYSVGVGQHKFEWKYRKDGVMASGSDAAWIDNITFPAVNNIPPIFSCEVIDIAKTMNTNQQETDPLIIANVGGGVLEYSIDVVPVLLKNKDIAGSNLQADLFTFVPGTTYDVIFTLNALSPDMEWLDILTIQFPNEITVNSATDFVGSSGSMVYNNMTGVGVEVTWASPGTWGAIQENQSAVCTINITFSDVYTAAQSELNYTIFGDGYGGDPHQVSGDIILGNESSFWLSVSPGFGEIIYSSETELDLDYNTDDMEAGVYYADIVIYDGESDYTIPVELTVDYSVDINDLVYSDNIEVYPNPFTQNISITYYSENEDELSISLFDITGKLIDIIENDINVLPGENTFSYSFDKSLSSGLYILKLETNDAAIFKKIEKKN